MTDETVTIDFDPPRVVFVTDKQYRLIASGEEPLYLPISVMDKVLPKPWEHGETVTAAVIPRWLAEKEELVDPTVERDTTPEEPLEGITRHDLFMAASMVGLLAGGYTMNDVVWEARKLAEKAMR